MKLLLILLALCVVAMIAAGLSEAPEENAIVMARICGLVLVLTFMLQTSSRLAQIVGHLDRRESGHAGATNSGPLAQDFPGAPVTSSPSVRGLDALGVTAVRKAVRQSTLPEAVRLYRELTGAGAEQALQRVLVFQSDLTKAVDGTLWLLRVNRRSDAIAHFKDTTGADDAEAAEAVSRLEKNLGNS